MASVVPPQFVRLAIALQLAFVTMALVAWGGPYCARGPWAARAGPQKKSVARILP